MLSGGAEEKPLKVANLTRDTPVDFAKEIFPFLRRNCLACHNATKSKADLILETPESIQKGGETGSAAVPGKPAESLIFTTSAHIEEPEMPPPNNKSKAKNLTPEELGLLRLWIEQGAAGDTEIHSPAPEKWLRDQLNHATYALAISGDDRFIACGRGHFVDLYDWKGRRLAGRLRDPVLEFGSHSGVVHALAFSRDGTLASGSFREIKIWRRSLTPSLFDGVVPQEKTDPRLAIEGAKATVTGGEKKYGVTHPAEIVRAALSNDLNYILTASAKGTAILWKTKESKSIATLDLAPQEQIRTARFKTAEAVQNRLISVYSRTIAEREAALRIEEESGTEVANSIPELELALEKAREERTARKVLQPGDETSAEEQRDAVAEAERKLGSARRKAAASVRTTAEAAARLAEARMKLASANKKKEMLLSAATASQKQQSKVSAEAEILAVAFSSGGNEAGVVLKSGQIHLYSVAAGQYLETIDQGSELKSAVFHDNHLFLTEGKGKTIRWPLQRTYQLSSVIGDGKNGEILAGNVTALAFSPDGQHLVSASGVPSRSGSLKVWNAKAVELVAENTTAHRDTIASIRFNPEGNAFVTASADKFAKVFSFPNLQLLKSLESHTRQVLGADWSKDGLTIATGSSDHYIKFWNVESGEVSRAVKRGDYEVRALRFLSPANETIAAAFGDNTVKNEATPFNQSEAYTYAIELTGDGKHLAAGSDDGILRIWDTATRKLIHSFSPPRPKQVNGQK